MGVYRTALGKQVDMSALVSKNEKTRAVGNMKVNARGDTIDSHGKVIVPVTAKVNKNYAKTVSSNQSGLPRKPYIRPDQPKPVVKTEELVGFDKELDDEFNDGHEEIEQIKSKEKKK